MPRLEDENRTIVYEVSGDGGSGYTQRGTAGTTFQTEVASTVRPETQLVLLYGSLNDRNAGQAALQDAATKTFEAVRNIAPDAEILVVSPPILPGNDEAQFDKIRTALASAASQEQAVFVDGTDWFANDPASLIGADKIHPTDAGHDLIAEQIAPHIRSALGY